MIASAACICVVCSGWLRPPAVVEPGAYFAAAKALANVPKHARASRATVTVRRTGPMLVRTVHDDGIGDADPNGADLTGLALRGRV